MSFLSMIWKILQVGLAIYQVVAERAKSDPAFKKELERAAGLAKNARTEKELQDAAKALQDSLVR